MSTSSYSERFENTCWNEVSRNINNTTCLDVERALNGKGKGGLRDFASLISPIASSHYLEDMARLSNQLTEQRFGKVIRLFAPLYLSNECNNVCDYCGFSMGNQIPRKTLSVGETLREAGILKKRGFDNILLVTGEASRKVSVQYMIEAIDALRPYFSNLSLEVQPLKKEEYCELISHGLHAVYVYQETYEKGSYAKHHQGGKKKNFNWRLNTPDRLGQAGIKKIGLGCLYGLTEDWRTDSYFAAHHLDYLEKKYWQTSYAMSFPRLRPCEGEIDPVANLSDQDLVQLICAYRIFNHELELSLSTRESSELRENLLPLGVTTMSAGSKTNPGGYAESNAELKQFEISDDRSPKEIKEMLQQRGYDPVWKDWDISYDLSEKESPSIDGLVKAKSSFKSPELSQVSLL